MSYVAIFKIENDWEMLESANKFSHVFRFNLLVRDLFVSYVVIFKI